MIIEMRTYHTKPGRRSQFLDIFRSRTIPAHAALGMPILGPFLSLDDPDVFFFMRGFPDLETRDRLKDAFYESVLWTQELEPVLMPMLDTYDIVLVDDPDGLVHWSR